MPTEYKRKGSVARGQWNTDQLRTAINAIDTENMSIREASRVYGIPEATLRRRMKNRNVHSKNLGPTSTLGDHNEAKIVAHIQKLQKHGFAPTRSHVRSMAFELAERLHLPHKFNREARMAGYPWLHSFLRRHRHLSIRKSEGVSAARALAMTRENVASYFSLLERTLIENELMNEPGRIYNIDETGLQLNNRPQHVLATKGSKNVVSVTSCEKGETISIIVCFNAEGTYIPPTCVFKGKNKKPEYEDGMPPGSLVIMSQKSAYVNSDIFFNWLQEQFIPRKPAGKVLLLLDGHSSHCSNVEMLEYAAENEVILFCLPSHSTQFLQPLDRGFFKAFKAFYYDAANLFLRTNPGRRLNRLQFGQLLATAWEKSATIKNAVSSFKATGIVPFDPSIIPDYAYLTDLQTQANAPVGVVRDTSNSPEPGCSHWPETDPSPNEAALDISTRHRSVSPQPIRFTSPGKDPTPGKMLDQITPVPIAKAVETVRKRSRQLASVLTDNDNISEKRQKLAVKEKKARKPKPSEAKAKATTKTVRQPAKKKCFPESSSDEEENLSVVYDDSSSFEDESDVCVGCGENYNQTKKKDDWIQCTTCSRWMHEGCTKFVDACEYCGKKAKK